MLWFVIAINGISFWTALNDKALKIFSKWEDISFILFLTESDKLEYKIGLLDQS